MSFDRFRRQYQTHVKEKLRLLGTPTRPPKFLTIRRRVDELGRIRFLDMCIVHRLILVIPVNKE
jgi:hypothetical protein